jgi:hypothetical protein
MNKKYMTIPLILILTLVSACGPAPEPTLSADDLANTAVANAWGMMTLTQAAIPTATATFPPTATFTPQPTFTPIPQATLPPVNAVVPTATSVCNQVPPLIPQGTLVNVEFKNDSEGTLNLSFGMNDPNSKGECVTYGYSMGKFDVVSAQILAGCYWGYAWVTGDKETSTAQGTSLMCMNASNVTYHVSIGKETIILK